MDNRNKATSTDIQFRRNDRVIQAVQEIRNDFTNISKQYGDCKAIIEIFNILFDVESQFAATCNPFLNIMNKQHKVLEMLAELLAARSEYTTFLVANKAALFKPDIFKLYQQVVFKLNEKTSAAVKVIEEVNALKDSDALQIHHLHSMHAKLVKINQTILNTAFAAANGKATELSKALTGNMFEHVKLNLALFRQAFCDDQGNVTKYNRILSEMDATIQTMIESIKVGCAASDLYKKQVAQIAAAKAKQQQGVFQPAAPAPAKTIPPTTPGFRRAINSTGN